MTAEQIRERWSSSRRRCSLAADELRFEYAAKLRDEIKGLQRELEASKLT